MFNYLLFLVRCCSGAAAAAGGGCGDKRGTETPRAAPTRRDSLSSQSLRIKDFGEKKNPSCNPVFAHLRRCLKPPRDSAGGDNPREVSPRTIPFVLVFWDMVRACVYARARPRAFSGMQTPASRLPGLSASQGGVPPPDHRCQNTSVRREGTRARSRPVTKSSCSCKQREVINLALNTAEAHHQGCTFVCLLIYFPSCEVCLSVCEIPRVPDLHLAA